MARIKRMGGGGGIGRKGTQKIAENENDLPSCSYPHYPHNPRLRWLRTISLRLCGLGAKIRVLLVTLPSMSDPVKSQFQNLPGGGMAPTSENAEPAADRSIDAALAACITQAEADGIGLEETLEKLGPASFCFVCLLLALPFLQPVPLGPYTLASGVTFIAAGWQMMHGRRSPLLPAAMRQIRLHGKGWITTLKMCQRTLSLGRKITRRRHEVWVTGRAGEKLVGWLILVGGLLLVVPVANLPFNNTFPALMILFASLAWLERDGLMVIFSLISGVLSAAYFIGVGLLLWFFGAQVFAWFRSLVPW